MELHARKLPGEVPVEKKLNLRLMVTQNNLITLTGFLLELLNVVCMLQIEEQLQFDE